MLKQLGAAQHDAGRVVKGLICIEIRPEGALSYHLDRAARRARVREGRYLLRTNLAQDDHSLIWRCYMQLCHVEEAFRTLKGDLVVRPIFHHKSERIEAGPELMPRVVLEILAGLQMLNVVIPTTDGRELHLRRPKPATPGPPLTPMDAGRLPSAGQPRLQCKNHDSARRPLQSRNRGKA